MTTVPHASHGPHYPSQLKLFADCRRRYRLKVIERRQVEEPFSPALEKGKVAHAVLKLGATRIMRDCHAPLADLSALVAARLPREPYSSTLAWQSDVDEITAWVIYGLSYLDPETTTLGTELFLRRGYPGDTACEAFSLGAVLDLALLRIGGDGAPFLEVIDYKSGRHRWQDPLAPVVARFVLKPLIRRHLPSDQFGRVIYTELYLAQQSAQQLELERSLCLDRWEAIKHLIMEIRAEQTFPPSLLHCANSARTTETAAQRMSLKSPMATRCGSRCSVSENNHRVTICHILRCHQVIYTIYGIIN